MASKKYIRKTCPYCGRPEVSTTRDHVVAREFFLPEDRANLPQVPACADCNGKKAKLEQYALSVLPFGSRHLDARRYGDRNIERRLAKNRALRLSFQKSGLWDRHPGGFLVPTISLKVHPDTIQKLVGSIVRGLFMFHWKDALDSDWYADATLFHPDFERRVIGPLMSYIGRPAAIAEGNLGRGTFVYRGVRSSLIPQVSLWQLTIFGGLQFGNAASFPDARFTKFSVVTRQTEAAAQATRARVAQQKSGMLGSN
jgi:hypothetical protein